MSYAKNENELRMIARKVQVSRVVTLDYAYLVEEMVTAVTKFPHDMTAWQILEKMNLQVKLWNESAEAARKRVIVIELVRYWINVIAMIDSDQNLLNYRGADWKGGYLKALSETVIKTGTFVDLNENAYGWEDYAFFRNWDREGNPAVAVTKVKEDEWSEYAGSGDHAATVTGYTADVTLADGTQRRKRREGTLETLMREILFE
jgi:hypothetical protein